MGYSMPSSLSFTVSGSLLKLISIESLMPSNLDVFCCPLLLLPSIFLSISVFSKELALQIRRPKYWSLSFSISPSNEFSGLISFRIDWFDLAVQGTQESSPKPQFKSISSSALSLLYGPTLTTIHDYWKNHSFGPLLTKRCLCFFNMLSMCVAAFLPRSKHLLISWLQSPFTVILEPKEIKFTTVSILSPSICH